MNVPLAIVSDDGAIVVLRSSEALAADGARGARTLRYRTRTGALLRVDGVVRGAFDREHTSIVVPAHARGEVTLEVERRALPTTGLPAGGGWRWSWLVANAAQEPERVLGVLPAPGADARDTSGTPQRGAQPLALVGHSHLDVAWLWTYEETHRKAQRTFATAVRQLEAHPAFVFTQSQPQLYAWLEQRDPALFARVVTLARAGRIDTSGAALWVEADCNLPSGESLLRQLAHGMRYVERIAGALPAVAWLPDSFGFPNTLPALLAHAGIGYFGTTKLSWNDTTTFPHPRFVWEAPDGSRVVAAQIDSIAGGVEAARVRRARARGDLLLIGHGDGGGGATDAALAAASRAGAWTTLGAWFARVAEGVARLPVVRDELYLEEHRGTATTHHDLKARNAACERALGAAELALAWARALHATPYFLDEARAQLAYAWELVLRAQFHDVLPGTAITAVARDARAEYDEADALIAHVAASARTVLPQARAIAGPQPVPPHADAAGFTFANARVLARFASDGTLVDLRVPGGAPLVRRALRLAAYVDRPARWDAWNVDRHYRDRRVPVAVNGCAVVGDVLEIRYAVGTSLALASVSLDANEPFLRVDLAVDWRERHTLLRVENELAFAATRARFGTPHGAVDRAPAPRTRAQRAKFEAPGPRFARLDGAAGSVALFALDTYGWSVTRRRGVTHLGHSLLRGPAWPDPEADAGEHGFAFALVPAGGDLAMGDLETMWDRFAGRTEVPMFTARDGGVLVVATKLADDGEGIVVRARECDGVAREAALRCGARAHAVASVDALERPLERSVVLVDGDIRARFEPFELRSFRVAIA
ncbi:MAG: glycoside hydrolase family 38 C-terminal domain-containing protein [Vulcanimicrobiaceae bacterium]